MLEVEEIEQYCAAKKGAYQDFPFGPIPICYKLKGKIFAQIYPQKDDYKITLKCSPTEADFFRQIYPGTVVRGYYCPPIQQPYWNTVYIHQIDDEILLDMIDLAYQRVYEKLPKRARNELETEESH